MFTKESLKEIVATEYRLLTFRNVKIDMQRLGIQYFLFALVMTWLAGVGRYWDNPRADLWQHLGLGSVIYIFVLGFLIWIIIKPLNPQHWSYKNIVVFLGLTSPTAFFYAIPVERYYALDTAAQINVWFLAMVALWRVILFFLYLKRVAKLKALEMIVAVLLPLTLIVATLTVLNLEHVVFRIMGGLLESERSANDTAYGILVFITVLSVYAFPFLLLGYLLLIYRNRKKRKEV